MTGANITAVGTPAALSARTASSRLAGVAARGSMLRASLRSSVVIDTATRHSPSAAAGPRMSRSRSTRADLVIRVKGCLNR